MQLSLGENIKFKELSFGQEQASLLVVDNVVNEPMQLVEYAKQQQFLANSPYYPGVRAVAPQAYQRLILQQLQNILIDYFELQAQSLSLSVCHYSIVTTPPKQLKLLQCIPHFDSTDKNGLAAVHYLFSADLGGTSFYRHRKTGYESIDDARKFNYFQSLESENGGENMPKAGYINGDTPLFERIAKQEGVFNRMVIYRRNALHSGSIAKDFIPDPNPATGRLSISTFIDAG